MFKHLRHHLGNTRLAAALAVVFLQGLLGAAVHFQIASHDICQTHQRVRHTSDTTSHTNPTATNDGEDDPSIPAGPLGPKEHDTPDGCQWIAWLNHTSQSTPTLQPEIVFPHAAVPTPSSGIAPRGQTSAAVIPLRHVSPINSPPTP